MNKKSEQAMMEDLLKIPGAKKAAVGVLVPIEGGLFHATGIRKQPAEITPQEYFYTPFCSIREILRLRSLRSAQDYLLRLRANAIADSPRLVRVFASRISKFESTGRHWSLQHYYHAQDKWHKGYIDCLSPANQKRLKAVASGMAFIPEANAICIRSLAGDVVVASESLQYFYRYMTLAIYGGTLQIPFIDRMHSLAIAVRIMNGSEALDFDLDPRETLPIDIERAVQKQVRDQLQFTFGHEYAHYLCEHLGSPYESPDAPSGERFATYGHELEFEADLYAVKNSVRPQDQARIASGGLSVLFFLHLLEEICNEHMPSKCAVFSTHPPAVQRIWRLWEHAGREFGIEKSFVEESLQVLGTLQSCVTSMIKSGREDVLSFYGSLYLPTYKQKVLRDRVDF